ncbi:MAG: uroporphyrinogen decarboxylase [Candidatus Latescibacteria bacterium]|nr:uroporphyrinogen decarboxylase [Candidatus Latescibacterota bacterium]
MNSANDLFVRAAQGERTERTPVWLMRQAGRTDPAYLALKEKAGLPLEELFRHPELAARISLLPRRLGIDAIIFFQDILTPLTPMGAHFVFAPGPVLADKLDKPEQIDALQPYEVAPHLGFVGETLARLQDELAGSLPVLGFAGAPLTLAFFILEGRSFGDAAPATFDFIQRHPETTHRLLDKLTDQTIRYLQYQARAGATAVQLFESAAFLLTPQLYREFALPYQQRIFAALKGEVTTIQFARDWPRLDDLAAAGADIISLPSSISVDQARAQLGPDQVFQGNLDNQLLAQGPLEEISRQAVACVRAGQQRGHIFNLDHGLLRHTPYEHILHLVRAVAGAAQ